jgi:glucose/arabinose dehydrogenase
MTTRKWLTALAIASSAWACGSSDDGPFEITAVRVASGLDRPLDLQAPAKDSRLFIVEQRGRIRILHNGRVLSQPFLDLTGRVGLGFEQGLVALAFHPDYANNGRFFVDYTDIQGTTYISEFARSRDPDLAQIASERVVLRVPQPFDTHNGGGLAFGPDGALYIALGDGGSIGDPLNHGQDLSVPYGKLLRIDVDSGAPFAIPSDNPFVATPGALPEIWAYGLRNPWRFSFDATTGDLYIGDVGQARVEEIDFARSGRGGKNFGWSRMEGRLCFNPGRACDGPDLAEPLLAYHHGEGCSAVSGGYVYRGKKLPELDGMYFYGDFCESFVRSFRYEAGQVVDERDWTTMLDPNGVLESVTAFGVDAEGELYIVDLFGGAIFKIASSSEPASRLR